MRADYRLRGNYRSEVEAMFGRRFRRVATSRRRPGDALLLGVANDQLHLGVETGGGFVHADVGIGRVVETPGAPPWPILRAYRLRRAKQER